MRIEREAQHEGIGLHRIDQLFACDDRAAHHVAVP
jgi:hypothetical protein